MGKSGGNRGFDHRRSHFLYSLPLTGERALDGDLGASGSQRDDSGQRSAVSVRCGLELHVIANVLLPVVGDLKRGGAAVRPCNQAVGLIRQIPTIRELFDQRWSRSRSRCRPPSSFVVRRNEVISSSSSLVNLCVSVACQSVATGPQMRSADL